MKNRLDSFITKLKNFFVKKPETHVSKNNLSPEEKLDILPATEKPDLTGGDITNVHVQEKTLSPREIIENKINEKWGNLLNSGNFRSKRYDIFNNQMYGIEHNVSDGHLVLEVSSDRNDLSSVAVYISHVISGLGKFKETSFIIGEKEPLVQDNSFIKRLSNFMESESDPYKFLESVTSGGNCSVSDGKSEINKYGQLETSLILKIKLDMEAQNDINRMVYGLDKAANLAEINFLAQSSKKLDHDVDYKSANFIDDIKERKTKSLLGNENDKKVVFAFIEDILAKHSINYPQLEHSIYEDESLAKGDKFSQEDILKPLEKFFGSRSYNYTTTIIFPIISGDFSNDYNLLHKDLKKVFGGVHSVLPDPSVLPPDPEINIIGSEYKMSIKGSLARLAGDIKSNAREEYDSILNQFGIREK